MKNIIKKVGQTLIENGKEKHSIKKAFAFPPPFLTERANYMKHFFCTAIITLLIDLSYRAK